MSQPLPQHPLLNCKQGTTNAPSCDFQWRIERLDGTLITSAGRMPRDNERIVERCIRCDKECQP